MIKRSWVWVPLGVAGEFSRVNLCWCTTERFQFRQTQESGMDRLIATQSFFFHLAIPYCGKISTICQGNTFPLDIKWQSVCAYLLHKRHQIFIPDKERGTKSTTLRLGKEKINPQTGIWTCNLSVPGPVLSLLSYTVQAHTNPPPPPPPISSDRWREEIV